MAKMTLKRLDQLSGDEKTCAAMILGWQTVQDMLSILGSAYHQNYYTGQPDEMRLLSLKRWLMASIIELLPKLNSWSGKLDEMGLLSPASREHRKDLSPTMANLQTLFAVRNCTFHFDDVRVGLTENSGKPFLADDLAQLYRTLDSYDVATVEDWFKDLQHYGSLLSHDAQKGLSS